MKNTIGGFFRTNVLKGCAAVCAVACAVAMGGCTQSVSEACQALYDGVSYDVAQLQSLTTDSAKAIFASEYTDQLVAAGVDPADVYGPMFSSLTFEVSDMEIKDNVATVRVTVTNKDLTTALQNYTATVTNELATTASREAMASLDDAALTVHLAEVLESCLNDPALGTVTSTVELTYAKSGSDWVLENGDALIDALLGGLDTELAGDPTDQQLVSTADTAAQNVESIASQGVEGQ